MPQMDGFELLVKIKEDVKLKNIPSVILTTEGDKVSAEKALKLGADSFIAKPLQPPQLLAKVKEYVK